MNERHNLRHLPLPHAVIFNIQCVSPDFLQT
jgi:hypothetical protein